MQQREILLIHGESAGQSHDDGKDHGGCADHSRANQHRLGRSLESVARTVILFEQVLGAVEVHRHVEVFLDFVHDVRNLLNQGELVNRLSIIRDWTVGIDGDRHRPHAQKAEGHKSEGKHRGSQHGGRDRQAHGAEIVANRHQGNHRQPQPVAGEIARHESGKNSQRRSTFLRRGHNLAHVTRLGGSKNLDQFRNHSARQGSAGNNASQLPPLRSVPAKIRNNDRRDQVGECDGDNRSDPDQRSQRRLEVHLIRVSILRLGDSPI